jgi:hypothetical protein
VGVVLQFTLTSYPSVELLAVLVAWVVAVLVALAAVRFEQLPTTVGQHVRPIVGADVDHVDQAFVAKVLERVVGVAELLEVMFPNNPKGPDGGQHAAVLAIQLVLALAVIDHHLAFESAGQVKTVDERVSRVALPRVEITVATVTIARVLAAPAVVPVVIARACVGIVTRIEVHTSSRPALGRVKMWSVDSGDVRERCPQRKARTWVVASEERPIVRNLRSQAYGVRAKVRS